MNEFEYYLLYSGNNPKAPFIVVHDDIKGGTRKILTKEPITDLDAIKFRFGESIKKPAMEDFLDNGVIGIVSEKIYNVLNPLNIKGIQLLPATIEDEKNDVVYDKYYYLNMYTWIKCLDLENSKYSISPLGGTPRAITKIVLDKNILSKIPLEDRLMFRMGEDNGNQLVHESIVQKIQECNPVGMRFINVKEWNEGSAFDD